MNPLPLLSVLLPVYQAASTLPAVLAALQAQTHANLEIIAVDDGSTDDSVRLLDEAAARDSRIRVIHAAHGGVWAARNLGIAAASGAYIGFCDADDLPLPQMYETMLARALETDADVVVCAFQRTDGATGRVLSVEMTKFGDQTYDLNRNPGILPSINTALWNKLFRADVLKNDLRFDAPPRVLEDMLLLCSVYPACGSIAFLTEPLYRYLVRPGSAMSSVDPRELDGLILCFRQAYDWIGAQSSDDRFRDVFCLMAWIHLGLSVPVRLRSADSKSWRAATRGLWLALDRYLPRYLRTPYATLRYNLKHRMQNGTILLSLWAKRLGLLTPALRLFRLFLRSRKAEVRW